MAATTTPDATTPPGLAATARRELGPRRRPARVVMATAAGWAVSAVFHLGVLAVDGGGWSGPLSWRKPIVFSASIALTLWAVGWILDRLPDRPRLAAGLAWTFAVSSTVEVALIAGQTWRGEPSHFNPSASGQAVFAAMAVAVGVMSLVLLALLAWALIERPADAATRWAVLGGLAMIALGLGVGQQLVGLGVAYVERTGMVPDVVRQGDAVVKFPHAVAFHGIQIFAVLLAVSIHARLGPAVRATVQRLAVAGYGGLLAFSVVQTVAGLAPTALRPWSVVLLVASVGMLAAAAWPPLAALARPPRP